MDEALQFSQRHSVWIAVQYYEFCDHERRAMSTDHDSIQHGLVQVQPLNNEDRTSLRMVA
jgi:hypothetical protein